MFSPSLTEANIPSFNSAALKILSSAEPDTEVWHGMDYKLFTDAASRFMDMNQEWVVVPTYEDKKTLLIVLFGSFIMGDFFQRQFVDLTEFFKSVPQGPWYSESTPSDAKEMFEAEEKRLGCKILLQVMKLVSGELRAIEGSPLNIPKTMKDVTDAMSEEWASRLGT